MGTKKTPAKAGRSSMATRRSASKAIKEEVAVTPKNRSVKKGDATFSQNLPTEEQRKSNGRVHGRSLIVWGRKLAQSLSVVFYLRTNESRPKDGRQASSPHPV